MDWSVDYTFCPKIMLQTFLRSSLLCLAWGCSGAGVGRFGSSWSRFWRESYGVPASILELAGILPAAGPTWYVLLQAGLGLAQFGIGLVMLAEYRRSRRAWGAR